MGSGLFNSIALAAIMLFAGLYLLIGAIRGKGFLYVNENVKSGFEQKYKLMVRISSLITSLLLLGYSGTTLAIYFKIAPYDGVKVTDAIMQEIEVVNAQCEILSKIANSLLTVAIVAIALMIVLTTIWSERSKNEVGLNESLSGNHPAFKKSNDVTEPDKLPNRQKDNNDK